MGHKATAIGCILIDVVLEKVGQMKTWEISGWDLLEFLNYGILSPVVLVSRNVGHMGRRDI